MSKKTSPQKGYWEKKIETLPRDALRDLQSRKLRETIQRAKDVPFYKEAFRALSVEPPEINAPESIRALPFTTKDDLRRQYPYGMLAAPLKECLRVHASSGTTGTAVAVLHTKKDLNTWADLVARCLYGVGVRNTDVFQNMAGYGLFTGGLGFHYGAEKLGALTIPIGAGNSKRQLKMMLEWGTTVVHLMPSFAVYLIRVFEETGIDPRKDTRLRTMFLGAEPHSEETRRRIESFYGVDAYDSYGLSETNGPGLSFECHLKSGLHIWEDHYLVEIIDPEGDAPVPAGQIGELVYTTLQREAIPLIRYRSRDLASFLPEPCGCGRTHCRISRIQGRVDDMIIWKGVNIFPMQIERVLMGMSEMAGTYLITLETDSGADKMTVQVETKVDFLIGNKPEALQRRIAELLQSELLVKPEVQVVPPGAIPATETGKARRVIDKRMA